MSFQAARRDLAEAVDTLTRDAGWRVTTETDPDIFHKLIVIGHASSIEPDTFASFNAQLSLTAWVSEADEPDSVDQLYNLISPGPDSLFSNLPTTEPVVSRILVNRARDVRRRDEGPSGFLAAALDVVLLGEQRTQEW